MTQTLKKRLIAATILLFSIVSSAQLPNTLSATDKIYGLSKFWQEVSYNFVYLDKFGRQKWDSAYRQFIPTVLNTSNDYAYFRELQRFCALLQDGHTNIYLPPKREFERMTTMFGSYRFFIENIDGKAVIIRTNLSKKNEIPPGTEVIEVNGTATADYIRQYVAPYISSSTAYVLEDWSISRLLTGFNGDTYTLKLKKPKGEIITLRVTHAQTEEKEVFPPFEVNSDLLELKWIDKKIASLSLNSFSDPEIDSLFIQKLPELYQARALIIDLRNNGGGSTNIGTEILKYLINDTLFYGARSVTRNHLPTYKAWGSNFTEKDTGRAKPEWGMSKDEVVKAFLAFHDNYYYKFDYAPDTIRLNAKRLIVPTAILIGHNTASAAEDFLIYADRQKHMITIGAPTFGSTGQPYGFDLVGGATARICTKKDTYPDGREFVGFGIKPAIEVKPKLKDYLQNKDPVLDKATEVLRAKIR